MLTAADQSYPKQSPVESSMPVRGILSARTLSLVGLGWHLLGFYFIVGHASDDGAVLGRYSVGYAAALVAALALVVGWLILVVQHPRLERWLRPIPGRWLIAAFAAALTGLALMWFTGVEERLQIYFSTSWFWLLLLLVRSRPDQPVHWRRWRWGMAAALLVFMIPVAITALTDRPFSPDEASWASGASAYYQVGGVYKPHLLSRPFVIQPGYGWSLVAYGWFLEHVGFDPLVGRIWNLAAQGLAFAGIGLVAGRLYGRSVALVSAAVAVLSFFFIQPFDYRPSHQLPFAAMLVMFAALQARSSQRPGFRRLWHVLCGLSVTLAMQLHAGAIVFIFGFSVYYLFDALWNLYHQRRWSALGPLVWYGLGAAAGSGLFFLFNILPVGGLDAYLDFLVGTRWDQERELRFLRVSHRLDVFLPLLAVAYLLWRRSSPDRQYLAILFPVLLGIALLDSQGYRETYIAFYAVPVGVLLVDALRTPPLERGHNRHSVVPTAGLLIVMMGLWIPTFINRDLVRQTFQDGRLPVHTNVLLGEAIRPYTTKDDVILSTHELIWEFHEPDDRLYSVVAETYAPLWLEMDDPVELWDYISPTVVVYVDRRMDLPGSLQTYMSQEGFRSCYEFAVVGHDIVIYRPDCEAVVPALPEETA